jgi:hypothetical protein
VTAAERQSEKTHLLDGVADGGGGEVLLEHALGNGFLQLGHEVHAHIGRDESVANLTDKALDNLLVDLGGAGDLAQGAGDALPELCEDHGKE